MKEAVTEGITKQGKNKNYVKEYRKNNLKDAQSWDWLQNGDLNSY